MRSSFERMGQLAQMTPEDRPSPHPVPPTSRYGGSVPETRPAKSASLSDDVHYRLLKILEERPEASQRELSEALGISLGKINYCVKALLDQGWIKATNFKNSKNKLAYAYLLTPAGIDAKARITARFLKRKLAEYAALKAEIAQLRAEASKAGPPPNPKAS